MDYLSPQGAGIRCLHAHLDEHQSLRPIQSASRALLHYNTELRRTFSTLAHSNSLKMLATNAFVLFFSLASTVLALPRGVSSGYDTETPKEKETPKDTPPAPPAPSNQPPYATQPALPVPTKETTCTPVKTASIPRFKC